MKGLVMPKPKQVDKNHIAVTDKIFAVLGHLIEQGAKQESMALSALVKVLPYSRTNIHRILYSLQKLGYVEKAELASHFRLATKFLEFTAPAIRFRNLESVTKSIMQDLLTRHTETINLAVLQNGQVIYIDVCQNPSASRIAALPGHRNPVHCTALGKVLIAFLPEAEISALLGEHPLIRKTSKTITLKSHLQEHLALIRERGIALDLEENLSGVTCVAAPIFDHAGRVIAGLSVSGPTSRMACKLSMVKSDIRSAAFAATQMVAPLVELENSSTHI
jgi:IclR family transcriptional regulator, KDG regulon repressor